MGFHVILGGRRWSFPDLRTLLARASVPRSGDGLAGIAATSLEESVAARIALADVPLDRFLAEEVVPVDDDAVTELIASTHDDGAFQAVRPSSSSRPARPWTWSSSPSPGPRRRTRPSGSPSRCSGKRERRRSASGGGPSART